LHTSDQAHQSSQSSISKIATAKNSNYPFKTGTILTGLPCAFTQNGPTPRQQTFSIKHSIGLTATGNQLKLRGNIIFSICPIFQEHTREINTDPLNFQALSAGFHQWLFLDEDPLPIPETLNATFTQQSLIGWHLAARGFPSRDWATQQDRYVKNNDIIIIDI
jgi:hypothetical protein